MEMVRDPLSPMSVRLRVLKLRLRCFWINLIICSAAIIPVLLVLKRSKRQHLEEETLSKKVAGLDFIGTLLFIPAVVCLLIALQFGTSKRAWMDPHTIALFVVSGILFLLFLLSQWIRGEKSLVPPRLVKMRTVTFSMLYTSFFDGGYFILMYYVSLPTFCKQATWRLPLLVANMVPGYQKSVY